MSGRLPARLALSAIVLAGCGGGRRTTGPTEQPGPDPRLTVRGYITPLETPAGIAGAGQQWVIVEVDVLQRGSTTMPASFDRFSMETARASYAALEGSAQLGDGCRATTVVPPAQTRFCRLLFSVTIGEEPTTMYFNPGVLTSASFDGASKPPALCAVREPETTIAACSDGCNNDGDAYVDCDDADCCAIVGGCGTDTYCGRNQPECVVGPEGTPASCADFCDNDNSGGADCNDTACCDVVSCGLGTACGAVQDPFVGRYTASDSRVQSTNPSTLLAGSAPCRAPTMVRIDHVSDGDTVNVFSVDAGTVEGPVRLIGVDTPELARNGMPADCYANEAAAFTDQIEGRLAWLTFDAECNDRFGRHLAYLHLGPNRSDLWQRQLVRRGFASVYTVRGNDALAELFEHDFELARAQNVGLHAACE